MSSILDAAAAKYVDISGGQVLFTSKDDAASAIALTANIGTSETFVVTNTQGTAEGAITLTSTAGGVDIDAATGKDVNIALDCAASEFFNGKEYVLSGENKKLTSSEFVDYLHDLTNDYPIVSSEEGWDV